VFIATPHNKSLDASGGSASRNLLGAAKGALIRAAASTPPLDHLSQTPRKMTKQLSQGQIFHDVVETLTTTEIPITVNLDEVRLLNPSSSVLPERLNRDEIHILIRRAIKKVISDASLRESLLVAIYDATEIKPGASGVSVNIKQIIERMVPDIREKLSRVKFKRKSLCSLNFLITPSGIRNTVTAEDCKKELGESLFTALKTTGLIREYTRGRSHWVELSHEMLIQSIQQT